MLLYIVSGELIPESNKLYKGRMSAIGNMLGFIIGIFATAKKKNNFLNYNNTFYFVL